MNQKVQTINKKTNISFLFKRKGIGNLECEKTYPFVFNYVVFV